MITEKMNLLYDGLKEEGFELSSASYEKDDYHIFYKSGLVLTIDLSTQQIEATMMYFDTSHEFISYIYDLDTATAFEDLLEHISNIISTNSTLLKWNLTLYEIIYLDKLIFLSKRDLEQGITPENSSTIKIDRIMDFDKSLFEMLLGTSNESNQITLLYNKLKAQDFKIVLIEKTNTGLSNITRALFIKDGVLIPIFYEESGVVLCGDIYFQTNKKIVDNLYIDDSNIVDETNIFILYRIKFSESLFEDVISIMDNSNIIFKKMVDNGYDKIDLSNSVDYLTNKYNSNLSSISNGLSPEYLKMLGMK
ncbi:hypothetical protein [Clostridium vincentii]|uniref:Uncharacterized protein n=1 Tax=Clostridium vincentii TaxID=52704 RepID=A0A2T0BHD9_9CLOT|nr:hypothetical protein [Clostridium vincentii]PRR83268.1 hypothetical protein CLVI_10670 [Clostridium vincentii]